MLVSSIIFLPVFASEKCFLQYIQAHLLHLRIFLTFAKISPEVYRRLMNSLQINNRSSLHSIMVLTSQGRVTPCLLLFALIPLSVLTITANPIVDPNRLYSHAGVFTFDTTPYFNSVATTTFNPLSFTLTFPGRLQKTVDYHFGYALHELNFQFSTANLNISLWVPGPKLPISINAQLFTNNANKISVLRVSYILIEPLFANIGFVYAWLRPQTNIASGLNFSQVVSGVGPFTAGTVGAVSVWKVLVGYDASLPNNKLFDCQLQVSVLSATSVQFTVTSLSSTPYFLSSIVVGAFIYNSTALLATPRKARFTTGLLSSPNTLKHLDISNEIRSYSSIIGVFSHSLVSQSSFSQIMNINPLISISGTSNLPYVQLGLSFLIVQFLYCAIKTPYLMVYNRTCLSACPIRYYVSIYSECDPCPTYDCYTCSSNGSCLTCSAIVDFRVMNFITKRCVPRSGFFDNGVSSQAIKCSTILANCLQCNNLSSTLVCTTCLTGYYLINNTCQPCSLYCLTCVSPTLCNRCPTGFILNAGVCIITCASIIHCQTCIYNTSLAMECGVCEPGYDLVNNTCLSYCGNSVILDLESCDDGNLIDGDGCSSNCTIEPFFFCTYNSTNSSNSSGSICQPCIDSCPTCINAIECVSCITGYSLIDNNTNCSLICTAIPFCVTCNYSTQLDCLSCELGYEMLGSSCFQICGDGLRVNTQLCDDGNTNSSDGCSFCLIQAGYFCSDIFAAGAVLPTSQCSPCQLNCINCSSPTNCLTCQSGFIYVSVNSSASCIAVSICGDGLISLTQSCDDGNSANGDGCSSTCTIQPSFSCTIGGNGVSICSIASISIDLVSIDKVATSNSITLTYGLSPTIAAYSTLDWATVVQQQSNLNAQITGFAYDSSTGQLQVTMQYGQDLDQQSLLLSFVFPPTAPFDKLAPVTTSSTLSASNNLSLQVYSDAEYSLAAIVEYVSLGLSLLALAFFILGFFSGKLIALEMVTVFQLTYFSLLSLQKLSPTFSALRFLSFSCGYSLKIVPNLLAHRRFTGIGLNYPFLNNYNLIVVLFLLPLIISAILSLINRCRYKGDHVKLLLYSQLLRGEFVYYSLLFSAYLLLVSAGITIQRMDYLSGIFMIGAFIDGSLLLLLIIYAALLGRRLLSFGEYVDKFRKDRCFSSLYYCWMVIQRAVVGVVLTIVQINFQSAVISGLLIVQIIVIACLRPYRDENEERNNPNIRPILNLVISTVIQFILCFQALFPSLLSSVSSYLPLIVLLLLLCTIPYNLYFWIRNFSNKTVTERQMLATEQAKFINSERMRVENLNSMLMKQNPSILFSATKRLKDTDDHSMIESMVRMKENFERIKALEKDKRMLNSSPIQVDQLTEEPVIIGDIKLLDGI